MPIGNRFAIHFSVSVVAWHNGAAREVSRTKRGPLAKLKRWIEAVRQLESS